MENLNKELFKLCENNNSNITEIKNLIENGADVNAKNEYNSTPLHLACWCKQIEEVIEYLVNNGANVNAKGYNNFTPLHFVCWNNKQKVIEYLVENGADVNAKDNHNNTPLHDAFMFGQTKEVIEYLVNKGSDVNAKDRYNWTPFHYACRDHIKEVIECLVNNGADMNVRDTSNNTPLHKACEYNQTKKIIKLLIKNGSDVNAKNNYNYTPLDYIYNVKKVVYIYNRCIDKDSWKYVMLKKELKQSISKLIIAEIVMMRNVLLPLEIIFDVMENIVLKEVYHIYNELIKKYNTDKFALQ